MLNCRRATEMMSQMQEHPLSRGQRITLQFHLMMCKGCQNYRKQLDFIRAAIRRHPDGPGR